jgi:hypothetical protein
MFSKCLENVRSKAPLVHCITNYVTVNDVAQCDSCLRCKSRYGGRSMRSGVISLLYVTVCA